MRTYEFHQRIDRLNRIAERFNPVRLPRRVDEHRVGGGEDP